MFFLLQVFVDVIFAYFAAIDPESGVTSYEVAWGTAAGSTDIKDSKKLPIQQYG